MSKLQIELYSIRIASYKCSQKTNNPLLLLNAQATEPKIFRSERLLALADSYISSQEKHLLAPIV
jgi:hypothetical protein